MTSAVHGQPPGRAGRVWLRRRLVGAQRGAELLEIKVRMLAVEQQRFDALVARAQRRWTEAVAEAERWELRAGLLSGRRGLRFAAAGDAATVSVEWVTTMGVRYPDHASAVVPPVPPGAATPDSSALVRARSAYQEALLAAAEHAAATAARDAVRTEADVTRRRLRAVQDRWTPRLQGALADLAEALEEQEREEGVRLRRNRQPPVVDHGERHPRSAI